MNIAICDDENKAIDEIKKYVTFFFEENKFPFNIYVFSSGSEVINSPIHFDFAFLDIEMDGVNGIQVGKNLQEKNAKIIIFFITAYDSYLDDAFNLRVFRYLPKPIDPQRLYHSLDAAIELLNDSRITFFDAASNKMVQLSMQEIIYAEIENRMTKFVSTSGVNYSKEKISFWKEKLTPVYFASPHLSFIVNLKYAVDFSRKMITLRYQDEQYFIPIAPKSQMNFREKFFNFIDRGI